MDNYEKVHLQASDVRYIQQQFIKSANSKLQLHLPTDENDDPLKNKVANTLDKFIVDAFELARYVMTVDGANLESKEELHSILSRPTEKIEQFDFELNDKLRHIYGQVEEETLNVTKLRRELPYKAMTEYTSLIGKCNEELDELMRNTNEKNGILEETSRFSESISDYQDSLISLRNLKNIIPAQKVELDRLDEMISFLESRYREDNI